MKAKRTFNHNLPIPRRATEGSAGFDLPLAESITIDMGQQVKLSTGWAFELPKGAFGLIKDRSSMAKLRLYTSAGVIDNDYRGEVKVLMINRSTVPIKLQKGEFIAQMIIVQSCWDSFQEWDELSETARDQGGFGSTNK